MMSVYCRYPDLSAQRGLTLVELMVSLVLSLLLMVGAMQLFSGSKQTYQLSDALGGIQENGRYALDVMARDLRLAGSTGCVGAPALSNILDYTPTNMPWQFDFDQPLFGYDGDQGNAESPSVADDGEAGAAWNNDGARADAFHVLFGDATESFVVTGPVGGGTDAPLQINTQGRPAGPLFEDGQLLLATDCERAALFRLTGNVPGDTLVASVGHQGGGSAPANCSEHLHFICGVTVAVELLKPYRPDLSRILPVRMHSYFVGNTQRRDPAGNFIPALYRQTLGPAGLRPVEELVDGVSDLQILYGVAPPTGGGAQMRSATRYVRADQIPANDWPRVVSVRLDLTVRSTSGVLGGDEEGLFEQTFSTTVAVRNRTL